MSLEKVLEVREGSLYWAAGKLAGRLAGYRRKDGYRVVTYQGKKYLYHRVLFAMVHGYYPEQVDHIDGDPSNNYISNLRASDAVRNNQNLAAPRSNNRRNSLGVSIRTRGGRVRYRAKIVVDGAAMELGEYKTEALAAQAYQRAKEKYHVQVGVRPQ